MAAERNFQHMRNWDRAQWMVAFYGGIAGALVLILLLAMFAPSLLEAIFQIPDMD
jgi:hypothetical protein